MIFFIIWVSGMIAAYFVFKYGRLNSYDEWTVRERKAAIYGSILFSWIVLLAELIVYISEHNNDKPAKW